MSDIAIQDQMAHRLRLAPYGREMHGIPTYAKLSPFSTRALGETVFCPTGLWRLQLGLVSWKGMVLSNRGEFICLWNGSSGAPDLIHS